MFVRVDDPETESAIEGFSYLSKSGYEESVRLSAASYVSIYESNDAQHVDIYNEDIPKLIKALQAAYDHIQKGK